jgi:GTP cyclohydrolase I
MGKKDVILNEKDLKGINDVETAIANAIITNGLSAHAKRVIGAKLMLSSLDENFHREGLFETPLRVAALYDEVFAGYQQKPEEILGTDFDEQYDELVLVKDIPFHSHCEHHMVPFFGYAHVAYIPNGKVVGISKLARLVDCFSKRLQIQERLANDVASTLQRVLDPRGVAVIITAEHLCMTMRGVKKPGAKTITSAMTGVFRDDNNNARAELMALIAMK